MSEEKKPDEVKGEVRDPKAKYLEALEKRKSGQGVKSNNATNGPKISGGQSAGSTRKMFRRKSGSA
jgi:hypothetical protein